MMGANLGQHYTAANEGRRLQSYDDATGEPIEANGLGVTTGAPLKGKLTIGIGHTGGDFKPGDIWTDEQIDAAFDADYHRAVTGAYELIRNGTWNRMGEVRQAALIDMVFQMGKAGVEKFSLMLNNLRSNNHAAASAEVLKSDYALECPIRADRNARMIDGGIWV